ncbi:MAG: formyltransferase family protein [Bacteroidota bacterium]|jgi:phosphoribosylglycinamide formyltransferase-1
MEKDRIRVAIMASGFGSNASALIEFSKNISCSYEIVVCISNKENPGVKTVASKNAIPFEYCPELQETQENNKASISLQRLLQVYKIDIIALSGYLKLIPPEITIMFKDRILNIHPSLLPKYGGKGMYGIKVHNAVLQDFNKETGASVHLVNEKYDEGRILGSSRIIINENCSAEELNEKVKNIENILYPDILHNYCKQFYSHS